MFSTGIMVLNGNKHPVVHHRAMKFDVFENTQVIDKEYKETAEQIGFVGYKEKLDIDFELNDKIKLFLINNNITVFSYKEVSDYMTAKAWKENPRETGWIWRPLRIVDANSSFELGKTNHNGFSFGEKSIHIYDMIVPIHALKKVKLVEDNFAEYKKHINFFVSDYSVREKARPDPFLLMVINRIENDKYSKVSPYIKKYVIDFWDEPGFGIKQMMKSDNI